MKGFRTEKEWYELSRSFYHASRLVAKNYNFNADAHKLIEHVILTQSREYCYYKSISIARLKEDIKESMERYSKKWR